MATKKNEQKNLDIINVLISKIVFIQRISFVVGIVLNLVRASLCALCASILWSKFAPESTLSALVVGAIVFVVMLILTIDWRVKVPVERSVLLALDMKFPGLRSSLYDRSQWTGEEFREAWSSRIQSVLIELKQRESKRALRFLYILVPIVLVSGAVWSWNGSYFFESTRTVLKSYVHRDAKLRVLQGNLDEGKEFTVLRSRDVLQVNLSPVNLVELEYSPLDHEHVPSVELKKKPDDSTPLQSFQMSESKSLGATKFLIQFSVVETSFLSISQLSGSKQLVHFHVQESANPKVTLRSLLPIPETWEDDKPLSLLIQSQSKNPLKSLSLLIDVHGQRYRESIYTITGSDTFTLQTEQTLSLEKYVDQDFETVEIRAEVFDQSQPTALIGYSPPLVIHTISAYGSYRKTLSTLRTVKENIDAAIVKSNPNLREDTTSLMRAVQKEADKSPFFDSTDRARIVKFHEMIRNNTTKPDLNAVYQVSHSLGNFLLEHEMLDDRERDRDFFVAARGLSQLLESNSPSLPFAEEKVLGFLLDRERRWKLRVGRLTHPENVKRAKSVVKERYFSQQFNKMAKNDSAKKNESLRSLSEIVSSYRQWINELEAAEDKEKEEREKERKSGLMSARDDLKKLQKRQLEVSKRLHNSDMRSKDDVSKEWPVARMHQNANIEDAKKLEDKLNSLTARSAERLNAAIEAMSLTVQNGEKEEFSESESFADLASRLLHQASKMTEEEQKNNRRARRGSSEKYYGQTVVGGDVDIEHEYRVDPRYREEVLDEVIKSDYEGDNRTILNNFLKRIIR